MKKKKHNNEHILAIGDKLFRSQGYHNTGTEEILQKAEYPRSSFYYHFKNKEGFGVKTIEYYGGNLKDMLSNILTDVDIDSPIERLRQYFFTISKYADFSEYGSCCLIQRFSIEVGEIPGELQKAALKQFMGWVEVASVCVKEAQEKGEIRKDMTIKEVSEFLFSMIYGGFTLARLSRENGDLRRSMDIAFKLIEK